MIVNFNTRSVQLLGDTLTPVEIYLRVRDEFPNSIILESSDYHQRQHSYSYICCDPVSSFEVKEEQITIAFPGEDPETTPVTAHRQVLAALQRYTASFSYSHPRTPYVTHGLFGFTSYNAVRYFEEADIHDFENEDRSIPDLFYQVYRYVIIYSHHNDEVWLYEHTPQGETSNLDGMQHLISRKSYPHYPFHSSPEETSNFTDEEFLQVVQKGIDHCYRGDVFQVVLSRRFSRRYRGDDFMVYRALRHINPSPYLFYFDAGSFRIFGSSPEAQIVVKDGIATVFPIAGTVKRTGNAEEDQQLTDRLLQDPKENAEHIMLVDLARNDLSTHGSSVAVETFREVQYYSHVIHLVSKVTGKLDDPQGSLQMLANTFPAGTLSGAPKHKALQLINTYERQCRGYYGGAIGYISFHGEVDHAIMIRTVLSKDNHLYYQAGAGVVARSNVQSELQEVNNKLMALKRAIEYAATF
ncbi:anthranilate synthase component I family protein [Chitinophaga sp. Mgbs1]|uniref:Anthranilate synthase component 1 n=1 Tax=Chitinophaga solisilvae TaxID=1233460 RepID=A0A3S1B4E3_9BACT|nr:anthranilate synthase component I family protein [Chitinophaga solisilvae]